MLARWSLLAALLSSATAIATTPYLQQSFFFDWNLEGQPVPVPVTPQCSTIRIKWSRAAATGPNPSPPYFLQIYTSTSLQPFIVNAGDELSYNFTVPFPVETQYQICMFDKNGYTGGCQDIYTVTEPLPGATRCDPIQSFGPLAVEGTVIDGPISRYGWIDTCTDISVLPRNGTPPFTYTVAPSLHPPYNITSSYATPMNWTVVLSWASSFFISVTDSAGNGWVQGPLHAGGNGKTFCLNTDGNSAPGTSSNSVPVTTVIAVGVGGGVGGIALGLMVGIIGAVCCYKRTRAPSEQMRPHLDEFSAQQKQQIPTSSVYTDSDRPISTLGPISSPAAYQPVSHDAMTGYFPNQSSRQSGHAGTRESYAPTVRDSHLTAGRRPGSAGHPPQSPHDPYQRSEAESIAGPSGSSRGDRPTSERVYIVHNDSGQAPVRVYTSSGADVVELPPQYTDTNSLPPGAGYVDKQRMALQEHKTNTGRRPGSSSSAQTSFRPSVPLPTPPSQPPQSSEGLLQQQYGRPHTPTR